MATLKPVARITFVLLGSLVSYGLSILGWGGFAAFFSHPPLTALVVIGVVLVVAALFAGGNLSPGEREDSSNRWVLKAFTALGLLDAFLPAYTDRISFWTIDGDITRWLGVVLFAVGGALRIWPVVVLGDRFSGLVAIQADHRLVTDGLYRCVRNPSYLGLLVSTLGWSLAFRSWVGVLLTALLIVPLIARMRAEEALLGEHFGEAYAAYRARSWRLVPWVY